MINELKKDSKHHLRDSLSFRLSPTTNAPLTDLPLRSNPSVFSKFTLTGSVAVSSRVVSDRLRFNEPAAPDLELELVFAGLNLSLDKCALGAAQSDENLGRCGWGGAEIEVDDVEAEAERDEVEAVLVLVRRGWVGWVCDEEGVGMAVVVVDTRAFAFFGCERGVGGPEREKSNSGSEEMISSSSSCVHWNRFVNLECINNIRMLVCRCDEEVKLTELNNDWDSENAERWVSVSSRASRTWSLSLSFSV